MNQCREFLVTACRSILTAPLLSLLFLCPASRQHRSMFTQIVTKATFDLGMTEEAVLKRFGLTPRGSIRNIRQTSLNEYELHFDFRQDDSESRLHPVPRLRSVDIVIDHPISTGAILADIPEAIKLCTDGCSLLGVVTYVNFNYQPHIIAYPTRPALEQSHLATLLGTDFRPEQAKTQWVPAVILRWGIPYGSPYASVNWLDQPIERVEFTVVAPSIEALRGVHEKSSLPDHPPVNLGEWKP